MALVGESKQRHGPRALGQLHGGAVDQEVDLPTRQRRRRVCRSLEGDVQHVDAGIALDDFTSDMPEGRQAGRSIRQLARVGLGDADQLRQRGHAQVLSRSSHRHVVGNRAQRFEAALGIKRQLLA
ncbi:hypothetical protein D9M69_587060 [compost metagenome]